MSNELWQACPKCKGNKSHYPIGEDLVKHTCNVCVGYGIISNLTGLPPKESNNKDRYAPQWVKDYFEDNNNSSDLKKAFTNASSNDIDKLTALFKDKHDTEPDNQIDIKYAQWCKETKRSGGVLIGSSIKEFIRWYIKNLDK